MRYVVTSLAETAGVIVLSVLGVLVGRWFSRLRSRAWLLGYVVPLLLVGTIGVPRWVPRIESAPPFSWIMADRMEFAAMALICTTLLTTPLFRFHQRRQCFVVVCFMVVFTIYFFVLPFLVPAFTYAQLSALRTALDADGVCLQSNDYNCGPAAAVTVLRKIGVPAEEGELAIWAHTTPFAGTPTDSLCAAIRKGYAVPCRTVYFRTVSQLQGNEPLIAVVKFGFLVDHYVAVLSVKDTDVTVGDPLTGLRRCTHKEFEKEWRKYAILIKKNGFPNRKRGCVEGAKP